VTLLLDLGVPPHVVRAIVGHSDIEVTMTIYAHAVLDEQRKALHQLGDRLALARGPIGRRCQTFMSTRAEPPRRARWRTVSAGQEGGQGRGRTADLPLFRATVRGLASSARVRPRWSRGAVDGGDHG
jgi:hypothetical protein